MLQLDPISLSFPTPQHGFALSLYDCDKKTCVALQSTRNTGTSWLSISIPRQLRPSLLLAPWGSYDVAYASISVHFADPIDGWIYGTVPAPATPATTNPNWVSRLWSTHNGGKSWSQVPLRKFSLTGGVTQMATHGAWTYLFGASYTNDRAYLDGTRSSTDQWVNKSDAHLTLPAGGSVLQGSFTFVGSSGWFVAGNDRGFTASARLSGTTWRAWSGPSFEKLGASFAPFGVVTSRVLVAADQNAGFAYPPASTAPAHWNNGASWLFISNNAGETFKPLRRLSSGDFFAVPGLPALSTPGRIVLDESRNSGKRALVLSTNWGRSWHIVLDHSVSQVVSVTRTLAFAVVEKGNNPRMNVLYRSTTAGSSWSRVTA
jgi:hypothetical protein